MHGEHESTRLSIPGRKENRDSKARGRSTPCSKAKKSPPDQQPRHSRRLVPPATEIWALEARAQAIFFPADRCARGEMPTNFPVAPILASCPKKLLKKCRRRNENPNHLKHNGRLQSSNAPWGRKRLRSENSGRKSAPAVQRPPGRPRGRPKSVAPGSHTYRFSAACHCFINSSRLLCSKPAR